MTDTRRGFLTLAGLSPLLLLGAGQAAAQASAACFDPATLPLSQKNRRRSIGYVDQSADAAKACGKCAFFTAAGAGCGTCTILGGSPVNASGLCSSFAAKGA